MKKITLLAFIVFMFAVASHAGRMETALEKIDINSASEVRINCDLGAGEFIIRAGDIDDAAVVEIQYDPKRVRYYVDSEVRRDICYVDLESDRRSNTSIDTEDNIWDITLSENHPYELNIDAGACDAEFNLGGLSLKEMSLEIGAASGLITFDKPNPIRMEQISIDAGASSISMHDIGNANFESFQFSGGAGSFELDFRGEYSGESEIEVEVGVSSLDMILPKGIPVQIEVDGDNFLSSVDIHGRYVDEIDDDLYESDDFEGARTRLIVKLEVGVGSIDVYFK